MTMYERCNEMYCYEEEYEEYDNEIEVYEFDEDSEGTDDEAIKGGYYHYVCIMRGEEAVNAQMYGLPENQFIM